MTDIHYLVLSALLTFVMLLTASILRSRGWTPRGVLLMVSNRDAMPEPSPLAARADRASRNMVENLALFVAVLVAARGAGASSDHLVLGSAVFFWARLAYFFVYLAGIPWLRTVIWGVAVAGLALLGAAVI